MDYYILEDHLVIKNLDGEILNVQDFEKRIISNNCSLTFTKEKKRKEKAFFFSSKNN